MKDCSHIWNFVKLFYRFDQWNFSALAWCKASTYTGQYNTEKHGHTSMPWAEFEPSVWAVEDSTCIRPHSHWDWHNWWYTHKFIWNLKFYFSFQEMETTYWHHRNFSKSPICLVVDHNSNMIQSIKQEYTSIFFSQVLLHYSSQEAEGTMRLSFWIITPKTLPTIYTLCRWKQDAYSLF